MVRESEGGYSSRPPLMRRTMDFALRIIRLFAALPKSTESKVIGNQLLRSGTSVGANLREASRARSKPEFISKMEIALMEIEETEYWLELMGEAKIIPVKRLESIMDEARQLNRILTTIVINSKKNRNKKS